MSDTESDIDIRTVPSLMRIKKPINPTTERFMNNQRKTTTKLMIVDALNQLKSRKGTSVYAIKKHLNEKFAVDTDKLNYIIKKSLKRGVEDGTFVQLKGIGASGSFKLVNMKDNVKKPKKKIESEKVAKEIKKNKVDKTELNAEKPIKIKPIKKKDSKLSKNTKEDSKPVKKKMVKVTKTQKDIEGKQETKKKSKVEKPKPKTPSKKKTMMKRKSIGSIIKPPKMKPNKN